METQATTVRMRAIGRPMTIISTPRMIFFLLLFMSGQEFPISALRLYTGCLLLSRPDRNGGAVGAAAVRPPGCDRARHESLGVTQTMSLRAFGKAYGLLNYRGGSGPSKVATRVVWR